MRVKEALMADSFPFDLFLSHSSKDKEVVREVAKRLRADGLRVWFDEWDIRPGDSIPAKIEEGLENSKVLVLCMSANAFGSDWTQLEAGTFRFRDPLNKERRFIPLRLDSAPIKGSLAQFLYINWLPNFREQEYPRLLRACRPTAKRESHTKTASEQLIEKALHLDCGDALIIAYAFNRDGRQILTGDSDGSLRLWDSESGRCLKSLSSHRRHIRYVDWSDDQRLVLVGGDDGNARLLDLEADRLLVDYGKSVLSKRQMDCFRLLAGGLPAALIAKMLTLHEITIGTHLQQLRLRLEVPSRDDVRRLAAGLYGGGLVKVPPLQAIPIWVPYLAWAVEKGIALSGSPQFDGRRGTPPVFRLCCEFGEPRRGSSDERFGRAFAPVSDGPPSSSSCAWSRDQELVVYGGEDGLLRLWNVRQGKLLRVFEGHTSPVSSVALNGDQRRVLSCSADRSVRLWDLSSGKCIGILTGHDDEVVRVAWGPDPNHALSGDRKGRIVVWDLSKLLTGKRPAKAAFERLRDPYMLDFLSLPEQVQYTNAKVLLAGDSGVGKSGLSNFLAHGVKVEDDKPLPSTDGVWATHWPLRHARTKKGVDREIWLWDFAGQVDYRLVHQIFMEDTAAAVLVFNPQDENPFNGLGRWDRDLQKAARKQFAKLLAAGRVDRGGLVVSAASMNKFMAERGFLPPLHLTSAKTGKGCDSLREALVNAINWETIPETTSPVLYHQMKQEILSLRDAGFVLIRLAELKQRMEITLNGEAFELPELEKVLSLLAGPGIIQRLDFGGFILLRPDGDTATGYLFPIQN